MDKIHIIIPVFDGWKQIKTCLDALRASGYRELEIIVVNHGTNDEIRQSLSTQYAEVLQVCGEPTLWWAGATNLGIRTAMSRGAKKIMLLNHDCYVDPETIRRLIAHAERAGEAIIAPIQFDYFTKRVLAVSARTCFLLGFPTVISLGTTRHIGQQRLVPTKLILGGRGVLIPSTVFERLGLFDEVNLPSYYSDHDFYLRCRERGIQLWIAADAKVYVDGSRTTLAANLEDMGFQQFWQTLRVPRSHRNLRDLTALFRRHYPIKGFHHLGVALNVLRYFLLYGWKRLKRILSHKEHHSSPSVL